MSETKALELGLTPRARFHAFAITGDDPLLMLTGPIPATRRILERTGLEIDDLDAYEVNEAFASVPLAWAAELGADAAKLNPWGGAIALGHALGSSGTRLLGTCHTASNDHVVGLVDQKLVPTTAVGECLLNEHVGRGGADTDIGHVALDTAITCRDSLNLDVIAVRDADCYVEQRRPS